MEMAEAFDSSQASLSQRDRMKIKIDPSVTPAQQRDPRFQKLLADAEDFFNNPINNSYKLKLGLHEAGHAYFAKRTGATNITFHGPTMYFDDRPQYRCPAISKSSVGWTPNPSARVVDNLKAHIGGFIVRREMSMPNERIAIEMDLQGAREWFDESIGTGDGAFKTAIAEAEAEILLDLKSKAVVRELWGEARKFVEEVFQMTRVPKKTKHIKIGRNETCPCNSGKKFKKCCINRVSPALRAA
jgi:SEC-C motif